MPVRRGCDLDLALRAARIAHLRLARQPRTADAPRRHALTVTVAGPAPRQARGRQAASCCVSEFQPAGDQPTAIAELVEGIAGRRAQPGAARRHRHRQDLHRRQGHRGDPAPGDHPRPEQDAGRAALRRVQGLLPGERGRVLRLLLRLLPAGGLRRRAPTPTSRRKARSTSRSTGCATRPPGRCSSATTSSSSPRSPASTASARPRPTAR